MPLDWCWPPLWRGEHREVRHFVPSWRLWHTFLSYPTTQDKLKVQRLAVGTRAESSVMSVITWFSSLVFVLPLTRTDFQQERLDILLEKNREGTLTAEETAELDTFERFEHLVRLLKARVLQKQGA